MTKALRLFGLAAGVWLIGLGINQMAFSVDVIPGGGRIDPSADSAIRTGGALFIGFGLAYLWAFWRSPIPVVAVRLLAFTAALVGVARLNSMAVIGLPHRVVVASVIDFAGAALTFWYSTLAEPPRARDDPAAGDR